MDDIINSVKAIANVTKDVAKGTVNLTGSAVSATVNLTTSAVAGTANITSRALTETAKLTTNIVGSSLQILNIKEILVAAGRQYLAEYFLKEEPKRSNKEIINQNITFIFSQILLNPLERIRVLTQTQYIAKDRKICSGVFDCFFQQNRSMGLRYNLRGSLAFTIYHTFYFNLLDFRIRTLINSLSNNHTFENILKIMNNLYLFDLSLLIISQPFESFATKIIADQNKVYSFRLYMKYFLLNPVNHFKGFIANLMHLNMNYILMTPLIYYLGTQSIDQLDLFLSLVIGMLTVEFIIYPFELIKRRMFIQNCDDYKNEYTSIWRAFVKIYKEEHISGFYKGALMKLINYGLRKIMFMALISNYVS